MGVAVVWPRSAEWRVPYETDKTAPSREPRVCPRGIVINGCAVRTVYLER